MGGVHINMAETTYEVLTRTAQLNDFPAISVRGDSPGEAKYNAWLAVSEIYESFAAFMREVISCKKAKASTNPIMECNLRIGDKVVMAGCLEAGDNIGKIFTVRDGPAAIGGQPCVWLDGYAGCFAVKLLKRVADNRRKEDQR
jgi:hypothetical protein